MLDFLVQSWFINTILVTISIGLVAFINKIFAERNYNQRFVAIILYGIMSCMAVIYGFSMGFVRISLFNLSWIILFGVFVYLYSIIVMTALRYLPTSVYFVNIRLISSFILLFVGIIIFGDIISISKWVGFFVGVIAMTLLFEKDKESKNINYKKGVKILLIGAGVLVFSHTLYKSFSSNLEIVPTFLLITFVSAFITAVIFGYKSIDKNKRYFRSIFMISLGQAVLYFYYFVMLFNVYEKGGLGVSYKIQSYSPFIPIILAVVIYKERITTKKKIALFLVAVSLWFFV